ncbi:MAG: methyltransferase [Candidatus Diapherotrites archaeon]|nr:methyltransferase [Candidatus Diapherotrites archaeon]
MEQSRLNPKIVDALGIQTIEGVYPPSEDSYLLANSIQIPKKADCLDLGCGSGIQGITMAKIDAQSVTFCDQFKTALDLAKKNCEQNKVKCKTHFIQSDLFSRIENKKFDVIAFNPPYVPSDGIKWKDTDGGKKGREVLDKFLDHVTEHLKTDGQLFFLQSSLNGEATTKKRLNELGFAFEIVARQKLFFEELIVYRGHWK